MRWIIVGLVLLFVAQCIYAPRTTLSNLLNPLSSDAGLVPADAMDSDGNISVHLVNNKKESVGLRMKIPAAYFWGKVQPEMTFIPIGMNYKRLTPYRTYGMRDPEDIGIMIRPGFLTGSEALEDFEAFEAKGLLKKQKENIWLIDLPWSSENNKLLKDMRVKHFYYLADENGFLLAENGNVYKFKCTVRCTVEAEADGREVDVSIHKSELVKFSFILQQIEKFISTYREE